MINNKQKEYGQEGNKDPQQLIAVILMQVENPPELLIIAGSKDVHPAKNDQEKIQTDTDPVDLFDNINVSCHFACIKLPLSMRASIHLRFGAMESVMYFSINKLAMGAA